MHKLVNVLHLWAYLSEGRLRCTQAPTCQYLGECSSPEEVWRTATLLHIAPAPPFFCSKIMALKGILRIRCTGAPKRFSLSAKILLMKQIGGIS